MKKLLLAILVLSGTAFGAKTTVSDTLYRADGSTCAGTISISWPTFTSSDGHLNVAGRFTSQIKAGILLVSIEPGNYYTVTYNLVPAGCAPSQEFWNVPVSGTPVPLSSVRSVSIPPPPVIISLAQLGQGVAVNGNCVLWSSSSVSWVPGACSGGSGSVTSISTASPLAGGPITTTGTLSCPTCGVTSSGLGQFASTTSAQLATVISDETGTGLLVFGTTPTLVTPTIASFLNANHNHQDTAGGGTLAESALALTNITTNNATTGRHGLLPILTGSVADCLLGNGTFGSCSGSGGGANTALSNLAAVAINTSLLFQTGMDVGSAAAPARFVYLWGTGTFSSTSIKLTGVPTGSRVWTFPDRTDTVAGLAANIFTGRQDLSGATSTSPAKTGATASLPGTCAVGDVYFANDATAGQNLYYCTSVNTFTQQLNSGTGGANPALSNLSAVSINTSLLAQTGVDLGSTAHPFRNLFLFGGGSYGTNYFELTGTPTGTRVLTLPNTTDTLVGKATTDTLTNKAFDTGGTGNTFFINGTSITAVEGNTAKVALFSGSNPATNNCAKFDVNHNLVDAGAACGGTGTVSSIATTGPITGGPIISTGTIACATCVTSAASLTSTAIMTGAGSQGSQTPCATCTLDASGNISTPGTITSGVGGAGAGFADFGAGTAHTASGVGFQAPAAITTPFMMTLPVLPSTGFLLNTGTADPSTLSIVAGTGTGSVVRGTLPTLVTPVIPPITFASITACSSGIAGAIQTISDSTTNTWGATITGSGGDQVMGFCNGSQWTVMGK
jgi:hypothetical protein